MKCASTPPSRSWFLTTLTDEYGHDNLLVRRGHELYTFFLCGFRGRKSSLPPFARMASRRLRAAWIDAASGIPPPTTLKVQQLNKHFFSRGRRGARGISKYWRTIFAPKFQKAIFFRNKLHFEFWLIFIK